MFPNNQWFPATTRLTNRRFLAIGLASLCVSLLVDSSAAQSRLPNNPYEAALVLQQHSHQVEFDSAGNAQEIKLESISFLLGDLVVFPKLERLTLNFVTGVGNEQFSGVQQLTSIKDLVIQGGDVTNEELLRFIGFFPNLEHLKLSYSQELRSLANLVYCRQIKSLYLSHNYELDFSSLEKCLPLPNIQVLGIEFQDSLTDEQLKWLPQVFPNLRKLELRDQSGITDLGFVALGKLESLETLTVMNCPGLTGKFLGQANWPRLRALEIQDCDLDTRKLVDVSRFTDLHELALGSTEVNWANLEFLRPLSQLRKLHLNLKMEGDSALGVAANLPQLSELRLSGANRFTETAFEQLIGLSELRSLNLSGSGSLGGPKALESLSRMTQLVELKFSAARLANCDWSSLRALTGLESLEITSAINLTNAHFEVIGGLTGLKSLQVTIGSKITDEGLSQLAKLRGLEKLSLNGAAGITGTGFAHFSNETVLQELHLSGCGRLTPEGLANLKRFAFLTSLDLGNCELSGDLLASLHGLPAIVSFTAERLDQLPRTEVEPCLLSWKKLQMLNGRGDLD